MAMPNAKTSRFRRHVNELLVNNIEIYSVFFIANSVSRWRWIGSTKKEQASGPFKLEMKKLGESLSHSMTDTIILLTLFLSFSQSQPHSLHLNFFFKWAILSIFFVYFRLFKQTLQFLQQIYVKKRNVHPVSIWHRYLNPRPLEYKSPPLTTRLPPFIFKLKKTVFDSNKIRVLCPSFPLSDGTCPFDKLKIETACLSD